MLIVSTKDKKLGKLDPKKELEALKTFYLSAFGDLKVAIIDVLKLHMGTWEPTTEALERYPFMVNVAKFIDDYTSCFGFAVTDTGLVFGINADELKSRGLPKNISSIVEYGDDVVPPFPHMRAIPNLMDKVVSKVSQGVRKSG